MTLDRATRRDRKIEKRKKIKIGGESKHWDKIIEKRQDRDIKIQRKEKTSRIDNEQ